MKIAFRFVCFLVCAQAGFAQSTANNLLTNAMDVLSLPGDNAWGNAVSLRGVVTAAEPITAAKPDWEGRFFVQDSTAGIFVEDSAHLRPAPGDYVEVNGITHPGGFAPFISYARWKKLGNASLPAAKPVPIEQLMAGNEDSQRVEITGVIRSAREEAPVVHYEMASGGYRLTVYAPPVKGVELQGLIGARVRVRGTASTFFSGQLRQLITVELHVPFDSDFIIENMQTRDPFEIPVKKLNSLGQYKRNRELGEQVHVKGIVTYQRPGKDVFVQDATGGFQIKSYQTTTLAPGDVVEAVGFPGFDHFLPILEDATFRKSREPRAKVEPKATDVKELQGGFRHADFIRVQGKVLNRTEQPAGEDRNKKDERQTILTLQNQEVVFTVESFDSEANNALSQMAVGSRIEVDGICFTHITETGKLQSLQILLPAASGVRILQKPDWLTPTRLLVGLAILLTILVLALTWIIMGQRRNRALNLLIREKIKAQEELQQSQELLEWRVAERTKQLKFEMSARKETEVQFKATLAERTRLARELHDTLEQVLTGIALQADTAAELIDTDPLAGKRHLGLVRTLMTQTQLELRRSIWDLRSRELEQFDFPKVMQVNALNITKDTSLKLEMETTGNVRTLPEVMEENLLRISQAAVANVIKHAFATQVKISLQFGEREITLQIMDNGKGFNPKDCPGSSEGHFGLLGMSERVKRLNGNFQVTSAPGKGTCINVRLPIAQVKRITAGASAELELPT
jgi:signal transduction histidine kinase